jgi:hypothetical protein
LMGAWPDDANPYAGMMASGRLVLVSSIHSNSREGLLA